MNTKHTPGPWKTHNEHVLANGYKISSIISHKTTEGVANALLIAAAPDLLVALSHMLADVEAYQSNPHGVSPTGFVAKARAAIAKATNQKNK